MIRDSTTHKQTHPRTRGSLAGVKYLLSHETTYPTTTVVLRSVRATRGGGDWRCYNTGNRIPESYNTRMDRGYDVRTVSIRVRQAYIILLLHVIAIKTHGRVLAAGRLHAMCFPHMCVCIRFRMFIIVLYGFGKHVFSRPRD